MIASFSDWVVTTIPSTAGVLQAVIGLSAPATSTTQMRQAPVGETFCRKQRVGMRTPTFSAAARIVAPFSICTFLPSIFSLTMNLHPSTYQERPSRRPVDNLVDRHHRHPVAA